MKAIKIAVMLLVFGVIAGIGRTAVAQDWSSWQNYYGVPVMMDNRTGKHWTITIQKVPSADYGVLARAIVNQLPTPPVLAPNGRPYGPWRLPEFGELQVMYNYNGGGPILQIRNGLFDYYETSNPNFLANAFGNGFVTPQPRRGVGNNWVIAVRSTL